MKLNVFAIHDVKVNATLPIWTARTIGEARRNFEHACTDPKNQFYQYPEDFTLLHVGEYDDESAVLIPGSKNIVATAAEFRKSEPASILSQQ